MELGRSQDAEAVIQRLLMERKENVLFQTERKLADRQDDTILLQINLVESKPQQGFLLDAQSQIETVLNIVLGLGSLNHYEKTRVYSMYTSLARISHIQKAGARQSFDGKKRWITHRRLLRAAFLGVGVIFMSRWRSIHLLTWNMNWETWRRRQH